MILNYLKTRTVKIPSRYRWIFYLQIIGANYLVIQMESLVRFVAIASGDWPIYGDNQSEMAPSWFNLVNQYQECNWMQQVL